MANAEQRLDIFPHIFPREFFDRMKGIAEQKPALAANIKRWLNIPVLWDLDARIKMMKKWPGYQQVLTLSLPAIEFLADENEDASIANGRHGAERVPHFQICFRVGIGLLRVAQLDDDLGRACENHLGCHHHGLPLEVRQRVRPARRFEHVVEKPVAAARVDTAQ